MTKIDILPFLTLSPDVRSTHRLGNTGHVVTEIDPASGYGKIIYIKDPQGWPWDIKLYDANYIYDWVTEVDWTFGPRAYKKFILNHDNRSKGAMQDGLIMFPRWVDPVENRFSYQAEAWKTKYRTFWDCQQTGEDSLGVVVQKLWGPFLIDHGGDVGAQSTFIHQYLWTDADNTRKLEENYFANGFGWISWKLQQQDPVTGLYKSVQTTTSNKLNAAAASSIVVDFPCF